MSDSLREAARLVGEGWVDNGGNREFAFDPSSVLVWMEVIKEVVALWQSCRKDGAEAKQIAENPGPFQKLLLRRKVKDVMGNKLFREHGDRTIEALIKAGNKADVKLLQKLIDES